MMYILTEEEYQSLQKDGGNKGLPEELLNHFAFFECPECGRLTAMEKSKKDSAADAATLAQGCPGCGENVQPINMSAQALINRVLK